MRTIAWPILLLVVTLPSVVFGQEIKRPLAELVAFGGHMDTGFTAFLAGKSPAEAWPDFKRMERQVVGIRADLVAAGVTRGRMFGMELTVLFLGAEERPLYRLRTYVVFLEGGPAFLGYAGRPAASDETRLTPLSRFTDSLEPIAKAAVGLQDAIFNKVALPFADRLELEKVVRHERGRTELARMREEAHANAKTANEAVCALEVSSIQVDVDDVAFVVYDDAGTDRGVFRAEFEHTEDLGFALEVGRFKPWPTK